MWIKQLCNRQFQDFAMGLRAQKVSWSFEKRATEIILRDKTDKNHRGESRGRRRS